jgi:hypothetical protein
MNRHLASCCALAWAISGWYLEPSPAGAKPPKSSGTVGANAKKVELFKAVDDKQVQMNLTVSLRSTGSLTLYNLGNEPLNVEVPLTMGATPNAPAGAPNAYYLTTFGTPGAPQALAVAVSPQWTAAVEKKGGRKSNVRTNKKKAAEEAKEDKKDDAKEDGKDAKKDDAGGSALVATVPLLPGATQTLPLYTLGLNLKRPQATYGQFKPEDLEKVTQAPEIKKVLEYLVQNKLTADVAQTLAYHYNERLTWDEMKMSGFINPAQVDIAMPFADMVEGKGPPPEPATTGKK